ncbi:MAG: hypothetical protein AAFZ07_09725 [Actinomycetota bacterium]
MDRLHIARSVAEATTTIQTAPPGAFADIVVIDVIHDLESGFDLLELLRSLHHSPRCRW